MTSPWWSVLVFLGLVPGLGLLVTSRLRLSAADRAMTTLLAGIVLLGLGGQVLHLLNAPESSWRILAAIASIGWALRWREVRTWWRQPMSRILLRNWLLVSAGSLLALAVIRTYSGGDWIGDWVGHYHRARYFLHQDPDEAWIFQFDPFAARPPLLNLATAALLAQLGDTFASYQIYTTLLSAAVVLPMARLVVAAGGKRRTLAWLPLVLFANPLFIENVTYTWTKIGTAAFVLAAAYFFRRAMIGTRPILWRLGALAITAGVVAHYSAAPYAIAFAAGYAWVNLRRARSAGFWRETSAIVIPAAALAATWFVWAAAREGLFATLGSETTTLQQANALSGSEQLRAFGLNLWRTLLPPPWPSADLEFLRHLDPWSTARDFAFAFYQTSLPGMSGLGGGVVLLWSAAQLRLPLVRWLPAAVAALAFVALAVVVHPSPMRWGAGHICLQPFALGLTALAIAAAPRLPRRILAAAVAAWLIDAALGVFLHLGIERIDVTPAVLALQDGVPLRALYGLALANNAGAKHALGLVMLGDLTPLYVILPAAAVLLGAAVAPIRQGRS